MRWNRREFLQTSVAALGVAPFTPFAQGARPAPPFRVSLAQRSFHRALGAKQFDHLDFARVAKRDFGIEAIEYVDAAKTLGCVTIRVNAASDGSFEEQQKLAADGLARLTAIGAAAGINVVVENHGGLSSNGQWLAGVMKMVNHPRCGTLPDFGNFYEYDRYQGVADLMPFAKAVSAKTHDFDAQGDETTKDYRRLVKIVLDAGFHSWIGIEYEGTRLPEREGVAATLALLERLRRAPVWPLPDAPQAGASALAARPNTSVASIASGIRSAPIRSRSERVRPRQRRRLASASADVSAASTSR
jgi:hypothetical protein